MTRMSLVPLVGRRWLGCLSDCSRGGPKSSLILKDEVNILDLVTQVNKNKNKQTNDFQL